MTRFAPISFAGAACALMLASTPLHAGTVDWTTWTSATTSPTAGIATGTAGSVGISYSGEVENLVADYPSWTPSTSYVGGSVGNPPPQSGGIIQLYGGDSDLTDTITFSHAVTNPVMAIWSLGASGTPASFEFQETPTFEAGGPSAEYGGGPIVVSGNDVTGAEGNGTIEFIGTFTSISWTNPDYENWYGFTVGVAGSSVPEPAAWALMMAGFAALGGSLRARRRNLVRA